MEKKLYSLPAVWFIVLLLLIAICLPGGMVVSAGIAQRKKKMVR